MKQNATGSTHIYNLNDDLLIQNSNTNTNVGKFYTDTLHENIKERIKREIYEGDCNRKLVKKNDNSLCFMSSMLTTTGVIVIEAPSQHHKFKRIGYLTPESIPSLF